MRSDGHLFITVIAYQMVQTIRRRLGEQGEYASWASLRAILEGQQRVTATFRRKDGRTLHVTYNRHAAVEARRRLNELIGGDARGVNVMTCHALAMRILGISFAQAATNPSDETFNNILRDATRLLSSDEATALVTREQMLGRLNWILVDEYQDIGEPEYELIAALAGKTLAEDDARLNLFAVGDDDQNIYAWKGASVRFIRRFAQDYRAKEEYLVENYRSSGYIIDAANRCIDGAAERLKRDHRLRIDARRLTDPPGGAWANRDSVAGGKVQILHLMGGQLSQAVAAVEELKRLSDLDPDWQWSRCAIIARNWADLDPARSACMVHGIPVQSAREELSSFWRARETQRFLCTLESGDATTIETQETLPVIGKLLGHTQVQTTTRYAHIARDSIQTAAARITGSIGGNLLAEPAERVDQPGD